MNSISQAPVRPPRRRWLKMLLIGAAVIAGFVVLAVAGLIVIWQENKADAAASCEGKTYAGQQVLDFCAGADHTLDLGGMTVTATPLQRKILDSGDRRICSEVTVTNNSDSTQMFGELDFRIQPPSGRIGFLNTLGRSSLETVDLMKGATTQGSVCSNDDGERGQFLLIYEAGWLDSDRGIWLTTLS